MRVVLKIADEPMSYILTSIAHGTLLESDWWGHHRASGDLWQLVGYVCLSFQHVVIIAGKTALNHSQEFHMHTCTGP
jgi:hypothetical protein